MEEQMVHQQLLEEEEDMTGKSVRGQGCRTPEDPRTSQAQTAEWTTLNRPINIALLRAVNRCSSNKDVLTLVNVFFNVFEKLVLVFRCSQKNLSSYQELLQLK